MKSSSKHRITLFATAIAASLVFALSAFGATRPDDRAGVRGPADGVAATQVLYGQPGMSARPDNRAGVLGVSSAGTTEATASASTNADFDWAAAAIGAGATGGVLGLLCCAALIAVPKRRHERAVA
jgi:hypothetical protein